MSANVRRNLAVQIVPVGGSNPLKLRIANTNFVFGVAGATTALIGQGGTPAYAYSIVAGALPTGMTLAGGTGIISGTPTVAGTFTFTAQVQDSLSTVYKATFSINVQHLLVLTSGPPIDLDYGYGGTFQLTVANNTGAVTYAGGGLPAGITVSASGLLTFNGTLGTPGLVNAVQNYTVNATDAGSGDVLPIVIAHTVYAFAAYPSNFSNPLNVVINQPTAININLATGFKPPYAYSSSASQFTPSWVTFLGISGGSIVVTAPIGTPPGRFSINFDVTDSLNNRVVRHYYINLIDPNAPGVHKASPADLVVADNRSVIVCRQYKIVSGTKLTIGSGAYFRIL